MTKVTNGPLHPKRNYFDTELRFVNVKLLHSGAGGEFKKLRLPEHLMQGAICGFQATMVPNRKNGIDYSEQLLGTAFFIAPGIAVSAWHLLEGFLPKPTNSRWVNAPMPAEFQILSPLQEGEVLVWPIQSFSNAANASGGSDVMAIGCHLSGQQPTHKIHHYLTVSPRLPAIGEKLHIIGFKEPSQRIWNRRMINLEMYESVGHVIDTYPNGRGRMPSGPCFALSTGATGGMSGAPVFDNDGVVVGILSTGIDAQTGAYSIVSSIAPVFSHKITQSWCRDPIINPVTVHEILAHTQ